jgi:hypothetical protein
MVVRYPLYTADGKWAVVVECILTLDGSYGTVETLEVVEQVR